MLRTLTVLCCTALLALLAAPAALAAPSVTVDPDSGLRDGQVVDVHGEGFTPGNSLVVVQCAADAEGAGDCDTGNAKFTQADATGEVDEQYTVTAGEIGDGRRCDADHDCEIVVSEPTQDEDAERASASISFAAETAPDDDGDADGAAGDPGTRDGPDAQGEAADENGAGSDPSATSEPSATTSGDTTGDARADDDTGEVDSLPNTGAGGLAAVVGLLAMLGAGTLRGLRGRRARD